MCVCLNLFCYKVSCHKNAAVHYTSTLKHPQWLANFILRRHSQRLPVYTYLVRSKNRMPTIVMRRRVDARELRPAAQACTRQLHNFNNQLCRCSPSDSLRKDCCLDCLAAVYKHTRTGVSLTPHLPHVCLTDLRGVARPDLQPSQLLEALDQLCKERKKANQ